MEAFNAFFKELAVKMHLPEFFQNNTLLFNNLFLVLVGLILLVVLILVLVFVSKKKKSKAKSSPAPKAAEKSKAAPAEKASPAVTSAPLDEKPVEEAKAAPAEEAEIKAKNGGKYEIVMRYGAYYFLLKANNGQLLLESAAYTTLAGAKGGIETFKNAVECGEFSIDEDKNGNFKFILRASARSQMLYHGETYATRQRAESAIGSVKNFAFTDVVKRVEEDDEDDSAATPVETKPLGADEHKEGGKYEIEERSGGYYFLLKANNGQLLLESPAFTSEQGAKSGIDTFKKAADTGFFVVDVDKKGKFRFILRANARTQVRYYGESYSTRQSAESSVHSVRAFAQKAVLK